MSLTTLSVNLHMYATCKKCMAKCVHPNTAVKTQAFMYLPGMSYVNMKTKMPCIILDSFSVHIVNHINRMPSYAQTFKRVSYLPSLTNKNTKLLERIC